MKKKRATTPRISVRYLEDRISRLEEINTGLLPLIDQMRALKATVDAPAYHLERNVARRVTILENIIAKGITLNFRPMVEQLTKRVETLEDAWERGSGISEFKVHTPRKRSLRGATVRR